MVLKRLVRIKAMEAIHNVVTKIMLEERRAGGGPWTQDEQARERALEKVMLELSRAKVI